jgi:HD-GYP domain-containing protein (c-di-GMP phosphodiesterase class II)
MKEKKMIVPEIVFKTILQHHECNDGTGYPKATPGPRICVEAKILSIADEFDYRSSGLEASKNPPLEHIRDMQQDPKFDNELLKKIAEIFKEN